MPTTRRQLNIFYLIHVFILGEQNRETRLLKTSELNLLFQGTVKCFSPNTYISSAQISNIVFKESKEFLAIVLFIQCVATVEFTAYKKGSKTGSGSGNPPDRSTG